MRAIEKEIKGRRRFLLQSGIDISDQRLWSFFVPKSFSKSERQLFLKLCVPNSGVLSKSEAEEIKVLETNNVTYLKLMAEIEVAQTKLTKLKKQYDEDFSLSEPSPSVEELNKDEFNKEDEDALAQMID